MIKQNIVACFSAITAVLISGCTDPESSAMRIIGDRVSAVERKMSDFKDETESRAAANQQEDYGREIGTFVVYVTISNGSLLPVKIRQFETGTKVVYVGPRGEMYSGIPTQDQLKKLYAF